MGIDLWSSARKTDAYIIIDYVFAFSVARKPMKQY